MSKWLDKARALASDEACAVSALSAESPVPGANCPFCTNCTAGISPALMTGIARLETMRRPMIARADVWAQIVTDAGRMICGGWVSSALALGWSPAHLWGVPADREGLAVWLRGRTLVLLDADTAVVEDGPSARAQFTRDRGGMPGAKLLWELS